ncbi:MAG: hypothetical protein QW607_12090 [Desulfurococcaceae archaeon]
MRYYVEGSIYKAGIVKDVMQALSELPVGAKLTVMTGKSLIRDFMGLEVKRHSDGWSVRYERVHKREGSEVIDMEKWWKFIESKKELKGLVKVLEGQSEVRAVFELEFWFHAKNRYFPQLKRVMAYEPLRAEHEELKMRVDDFEKELVSFYEFNAPTHCSCDIHEAVYKNGSWYYVEGGVYQIGLPSLTFERVHEVLKEALA